MPRVSLEPAVRRGRRRFLVPALLGLLAACGGDGGGGGGGGGPAVPTGTIDAVVGSRLLLRGDVVSVTVTTNDDGNALFRLVFDEDGNPLTSGDQTTVFGPQGHSAGNPLTVDVTVPATVAVGSYHLMLIIDDGINPPVTASFPTPLRIYPAIAGLAPGTGSNRYAVINGTVWFSRSEQHDGAQDFSGDGMDGDAVIAKVDALTLALVQGPVTVEKTTVDGGTAQILPTHHASGVVAWTHLEADDGGDFDGDGLANDRNLAVWQQFAMFPQSNLAGGVTTLLGAPGGRAFATFAEAGQGPGGTNRNPGGVPADVDAIDAILGYVDAGVATTTDSGLVFFRFAHAGGEIAISSDDQVVAWLVSEAAHGGADLNGDGDAADNIPFLNDFLTGGGVPGGTASVPIAIGGVTAPTFVGRDVDPTATLAAASPGWIAYVINEASYGVDVNGDGLVGFALAHYDGVTLAEVLVPPASPGANTPGPAARHLHFSGPRMLFTLQEQFRAEGALGTNNDGDGGIDNEILCWIDTSLGGAGVTIPVNPAGVAGLATLTGIALDGGAMREIVPGWFGLDVVEAVNGNIDINGNGLSDTAFLLLDANTPVQPTLYNPQLRTIASSTIPTTGVGDPGGVLVRVQEALNGGDLDGDGNGAELLFTYISFAAPSTPVFLDAGGDHGAVYGGWIGVTAFEAQTNADYDGNGLATDHVFRVFATDGSVQLEGTLSSPLSVPTSQDGTVWAYLRNEIAEGRDLNGDGDVGDLILGLFQP